MDENYLLLSRSFAELLAVGFSSGRFPFAPKLTFALNLGFLVPLFQRPPVSLTVFDDQDRFCWPGRAGTKVHTDEPNFKRIVVARGRRCTESSELGSLIAIFGGNRQPSLARMLGTGG